MGATKESARFGVFAFFLVGSAFGQAERGTAGLRLRLTNRLRLFARLTVGILRRLLCLILGQLSLLGSHDAEIMLRMLKIILGHHTVAAGIGIAGELQILLVNMAGRATDLDFGSRGIERPVGIKTTTTAAAIVVTAAIVVLRPAAA